MTIRIKTNKDRGNKSMTKTELKARPVVQNKFWVVENGGQQVATIQKNDTGVVYVEGQTRTFFKNLATLTADLNVVVDKGSSYKISRTPPDIGGYPTQHTPHNVLYDVKHHTYIYTRTRKSKSYYCAGHFAVNLNGTWIYSFCPKLITIQRYQFRGPFMTRDEAVA